MKRMLSLCLGCWLSGCSGLWGGTAQTEPQNCIANPDACGPAEVCNPQTEVCQPQVPAEVDMAMAALLSPPTSFIFPGGLVSTLDFPRPSSYVLEAQGPATIYYTLDGTQPIVGNSATKSGPSPVKLGNLSASTKVRWFASYGPSYSLEPPHLFSQTTSSENPKDMGMIPESALFDLTGSSVVMVAPGTALTGKVRFQAWQSAPSGYCPGCIIQFVVSAQSVGAVGCMNTVSTYGPYPGQTAIATFSLTAPTTKGRYRLYAGLSLNFSCDGASPDGPDVGEIVVQ